MAKAPTEHFQNASCWLGSHGRVNIQLFDGEITRTEIDTAHALAEAIFAKHPDGVISIAVISTKALPRLTDEARKRTEIATKQMAGKLRTNVQIVEGDGFVGASVRAILSGLNLFNPSRGRIFASVPEAAAWLEAQRDLAVHAKDLVEVVESARAAWRR